jgi:hypothetical protein
MVSAADQPSIERDMTRERRRPRTRLRLRGRWSVEDANSAAKDIEDPDRRREGQNTTVALARSAAHERPASQNARAARDRRLVL